jgi:integral membrane sensor domain MASE1
LPDVPMNWVLWWLGDMLGVLVALPLMIWLTDEPRTR